MCFDSSRKLLDRESRYSTIERECLTIVWGLMKFSRYLLSGSFVSQTDHGPLTYILFLCQAEKHSAHSLGTVPARVPVCCWTYLRSLQLLCRIAVTSRCWSDCLVAAFDLFQLFQNYTVCTRIAGVLVTLWRVGCTAIQSVMRWLSRTQYP